MPDTKLPMRYRFGGFEADPATGELRRRGLRVKLHAQPFQVLCLLLARPGEVLTREEISKELWPDGTFVDYEHGVNSAVNRLREALGDKAGSPRFIETLARRGYRFVAPVERIGDDEPVAVPAPASGDGFLNRVLAGPADLPEGSAAVARVLFILLQVMYLAFYVGALANLEEINELVSAFGYATWVFTLIVATAAVLIPVRAFLISAVLFRAPAIRRRYLTLWLFVLPLDGLWAMAPFLLLHHIKYGVALACMTLLVYSPFAQRSLMLMGAADPA
jgi:cholera toxin transcriptional activator